MINPAFYNRQNVTRVYLNGKSLHYLRRRPTVVLEKYAYTMKEGETLYHVAVQVFGEENMHLWTIIGEMNQLRQPDEWLPGDSIWLPSVILTDDSNNSTVSYESATSFSTLF